LTDAVAQQSKARVALLRKQSNITQVQLAETLGVSQSSITAYKYGQRRVPVSMLPLLARTLGVSVEELIGEQSSASARKHGRAPKLEQQLQPHQRAAQAAPARRDGRR
jgi:transcriptional regulator with XRE-family HTH domain